MATEFHIDDSGINVLFSERGDAGIHIGRVREKIVFLAKRYVGKKTRRTERSISARTLRANGDVIVTVTADTHYALEHHNGTRPHWIFPNTQRVLRFKQGGRVVYAQKVLHPGTRPNPFLLRALRESVR